ncbi:hypothetical protein TKK_0016640 [Trichogramma kaykai]|uniref:Reverse transcriptase domain-containing protein n=1 Tax=Trichogramma kaykai TaxID=54128 RepID=A0ABD2W5I1_9HYME
MQQNTSGKSPGADRVIPEALKNALVILPEITDLFNKCLASGKIPSVWKKGVVISILKPEKDEILAKSYRPICLLSLIGKTFERLIIDRAEGVIHRRNHELEHQYGFKEGRSTEDAILKFRQLVEENDFNYALAFPLDISGAFDNLWWPELMYTLRKRSCPRNLFRLLIDYFAERKLSIVSSCAEASKHATKGAPQGSIIGPVAWNLKLDDLLNLLETEGIPVLAYADDIMIVIRGNSREALEREGNRAIGLADNWCKQRKLEISVPKSDQILPIKKDPDGQKNANHQAERLLSGNVGF